MSWGFATSGHGKNKIPVKPARPRSHPGCPELTHARFCEQYASQEQRRYRRFERDPKINRRYGHAWRKIRDRYIAAHPLCEDCLEAGRTTLAAEVHHVLPLGYGGSHDTSNLRALCKPCHSRQSAVDGDRWRNGPRVYTY